jgi:hypothetical protein
MTRPETVPSTSLSPSIPPHSTEAPAVVQAAAFAHASEAEFARILDFYGVRWEYEPHTFPILWNLDGGVAESFSPDFWLPDVELYVELTTLRQSLVRKKNRKLRRLRELYPDVRVKLFYGRDFRALMLKYGKLALVEGLTGAPGQASLVRAAVMAVDEPLEEPAIDATASLVLGRSLPRAEEPDPSPNLAAAEVVAPPLAAPAAAEPSAATTVESDPPTASRSARRRRRRRAAARLRRRAQIEEAPSPSTGRHEPMTRR